MLPPLSTTTRSTALATKTRKALLPDPHTPCDLPLSSCSHALESKERSCSKSTLSSNARLASPYLSGKPRWKWRQTGKLAARAEARAAAQVVDAKANVAERVASKTMTQYDAAYFATATAASKHPRLDLGKLDPLIPASKEILEQECELRDLPVKWSGDNAAHPRQATELVQFLVRRLRDFHDGSSNIPKLTYTIPHTL